MGKHSKFEPKRNSKKEIQNIPKPSMINLRICIILDNNLLIAWKIKKNIYLQLKSSSSFFFQTETVLDPPSICSICLTVTLHSADTDP